MDNFSFGIAMVKSFVQTVPKRVWHRRFALARYTNRG